MGELWNLPESHTALEVGLPEGACSRRLCRSCKGRTRMGELWNLPESHTALEVGLLEGTCSHRLCPPIPCAQMKGMRKSFFYPLTASIERRGYGALPHDYPWLFPHPNDRAVESVGAIPAAGSRFAKG